MDAIEARFWQKVDKKTEDECWNWLAAVDKEGYGQFWDPERRTMGLAHRFSFELHNGKLNRPKGLYGAVGTIVRHKCDNTSCVNPNHLLDGSQDDNMQDMKERGRAPKNQGELNPNAKLTDDQIREIRENYLGFWGEKMAIARKYKISSGYVSKILAGQFR